MVEFFNTGIDTEYLTIFIVTLGLIAAIILLLSIYHLQKLRPNIKIDYLSSNVYNVDDVSIQVYVKNIGNLIAEEMKCEITSMTKGIAVHDLTQSTDLKSNSVWAPSATVSIKEGEKCKIKIKVSWDNHTFLFTKRNKLTEKFTCNRESEHSVLFD